MMVAAPGRAFHPIRVLHLLFCVGLAGVFLRYGWLHHPVRAILRTPGPGAKADRPLPPGGLPFGAELARRLALVRVILPDILGASGVLLLFSLGTGVYVRRFEVWLEAHQSGQAAAIRGVGLDRAALGANKHRKRGAIL